MFPAALERAGTQSLPVRIKIYSRSDFITYKQCYISIANNKYKVIFCLWCVGSMEFSVIALPGERGIKLGFKGWKDRRRRSVCCFQCGWSLKTGISLFCGSYSSSIMQSLHWCHSNTWCPDHIIQFQLKSFCSYSTLNISYIFSL